MKRQLTILILIELLGFSVLQAQSSIFRGATARFGKTISTQAPPFPDPLVILTATLPGGGEDVPYAQNLNAAGGTAPYEWALAAVSDPLPPGLSLSSAGLISGTPTASGDYPFTVRVTDEQPVFQTRLLAIHIDPASPGGGVIFSSDGDDTGNMSAYVSAGGSSITSSGLIDGNKEITKTTATDTVLVDDIDAPEVFVSFDEYRDTQTNTGPATNRYQALVALDSSNNVLWQYGVETDWDVFAKISGQTSFNNRGFFLQFLPEGTSRHFQLHYRKGTGSDALFEVRANGGAVSSFNGGTPTANVDRIILREHNDSATQAFVKDRIKIRTDTWEDYTPAVPAPPASGNCLNQSCAVSYSVPSGSDRELYFACASEGANRDVSSVSSDVSGALTKVIDHDANGCNVEIWRKVGPVVGQNVTTATFTGTTDVRASCGAMSVSGMAGSSPEATATNSTPSNTALATNITTASANALIVSALCGGSNGNATPGSGQIEFFDGAGPSGAMFGAGSTKSGNGTAGSKTFNYTASGAMALTAVGAVFQIATAVSGTQLTSYGAVCNGLMNDGTAIQNAFDDRSNWTNNTLIFPTGQVCVTGRKLTLNSDGWTILGNGSTIKAQNGLPCNSGGPLVQMFGAKNFTWNNLDIDGNRANRCVQEHSSGDNLRLLNVRDANFVNLDSKNGTNDNLSVRAGTPSNVSTISRNITFTDSKFSNAYRNNVSVIEGYNIRFMGTCSPGPGGNWFLGTCTCQMTNANGTGPEDGIDWEPNSGSAAPNIQDGLVDGCQLSGNGRHGYSDIAVNQGAHNITLQNSIIRDNGWGVGVRAHGTLMRNNYFSAPTSQLRFGWVYVTGVTSNATPLSPARPVQIIDNFFDGAPPVGYDSGQALMIYFGNCTPQGARCGGVLGPGFGDGTSQFKNNTITNSGIAADGNWCSSGPTGGGGSTVSGNTLQGTLQSPNPGCP